MNPVFITIFIVLTASIAAFIKVYINRRILYGGITRSLNTKLLSVVLPIEPSDKRSEKESIAIMEQFYSALSSVKSYKFGAFAPKPYIVLEIAVSHVGENISFYVAAPERLISSIEKQIYSYFPKAQIALTEDFNIFNPAGGSVVGHFKLSKDNILPIKTYKELETDPIGEITNSLSKLDEVGEGAALQIIMRPAEKRNRSRGLSVAKFVRRGASLGEAMKKVDESPFKNLLSNAPKKEDKEKSGIALQEEIIKAIESKASKPQFEVNIRLVASAKNENEAETILNQLENSFSQFNHSILNSFDLVMPKKRKLKNTFFDFSYRLFNESEKMILSTEELSSIYHFPNTQISSPRLKAAKSAYSEPPADLPKDGLVIGKNIYRGDEKEVRLGRDDRRRHLYVIGQTGTGKSTLIKNMIVQDIVSGAGVGILDPHGDIAEDILGLIPKNRVNDVIVVDPSNLAQPIGLNMLEFNPAFPEQKTFIVNEIINILDKLYDLKTTGGPMFEQYTRNALLLLMEYPERGFTLLEIPRVLSDKEFRKELLSNCANILVRDFWEKEAERAGGEAALVNMVPYITSKFNIFLANDYIRPIIAQSKSSINFREIMDSKKILIVNLTKGRLGDINAALLGLIIVGKILMAAFSRVDSPENERPDFYLYLDEFQNFATDSIATILSEARKYRLNLVIAHQFIEQLKKEIKDAVFGNVGSMIALRVGADDAKFLVKQFEPVFNENDLVNIDNFNAYVKLLISGRTSKPFSIRVNSPLKGDPAWAAGIKKLSATKYGRDRNLVEADILRRLRPEHKGS